MPASKPHDKTETIQGFLRRIGRKGGKKSQQHPKRKLLNRKAAEARWRKLHPIPKKV